MREIVPDQLVELIFKLNLPMKLIGSGKKAFPFSFRSRDINGDYIIRLELGLNDISQIDTWEVELKGRIDVEFLKYRGQVELTPLKDEPDYYRMTVKRLYRENQRGCKRVPYRRSIQLVEPITEKAVLINISASGALLHSQQQIPGDEVSFKLILAKRPLELTADIVEQTYSETMGIYVIRCRFDPISTRDVKHINNVVKEIILMAKERLK